MARRRKPTASHYGRGRPWLGTDHPKLPESGPKRFSVKPVSNILLRHFLQRSATTSLDLMLQNTLLCYFCRNGVARKRMCRNASMFTHIPDLSQNPICGRRSVDHGLPTEIQAARRLISSPLKYHCFETSQTPVCRSPECRLGFRTFRPRSKPSLQIIIGAADPLERADSRLNHQLVLSVQFNEIN